MKILKYLYKRKLYFLFIFLFAVGCIFRAQSFIGSYEKGIIHDQNLVPEKGVALVFGAGLKWDGTPTDALRDRIMTGIDLYNAKKVKKLVMTGDNGSRYYDEVSAMKKMAVAKGVPAKDIVLDYAGFRTYDSCYRARDVFRLNDIIVVSQDFHLPRILYMCNTFGVKSVGFSADKNKYRDVAIWETREFLANFKAWFQVEITHPKPKFLGPVEKVFD